ncbi:MAG: hypothetical protein ACU826_10240, partial [Gammaproteobacteria bacterium]
MRHPHSHLFAKVICIGVFIAVLVYLFHPGVGQLSLTINGQPVPEPWAGLAALPAMLLILAISAMLGLLMVAPYFWPMLVVIFLMIALMS